VWEKNIHCPHLILEFEARRRGLKRKVSTADEGSKPKKKQKSQDNNPRFFDRGLEPEKIITAKKNLMGK